MNARFTQWSDEKGLLPDCQAGFRRGHTTTGQIFVLNTIVEGRLRRGRATYVAFIDFSKAFDSVNRQALWFKLAKMGASRKFLNILTSMYNGSEFTVKIDNNTTTEPVNSETGVLQGAQNSPALFTHFIADIAEIMQNEEHPPNLWNRTVPMLCFADDIALISTSVLGLQRMLNKLSGYCEEWKLRVNLDKTKVVVFKKGCKLKRVEKWQYRGENVDVVTNFNYLGIRFSFNGNWNAHLKEKETKCKYLAANLVKFIRRHGDCSVKLFKHLFGSLVISAMTYGAEVFALSPRMDLLVRQERQFYRKVFGLPNGVAGVAVDVALGIVGVDAIAKEKMLNYWHKLSLGRDNSLRQLAYLQQREWADQGLDSWGTGVKNELNKMGLVYLWSNPGRTARNKFKKVTKDRLYNIMFQNKVMELDKFISAKYLKSIRPSRILPSNKINSIKSERRRRCYLKIMLNAHEDLTNRVDDIRCCKSIRIL